LLFVQYQFSANQQADGYQQYGDQVKRHWVPGGLWLESSLIKDQKAPGWQYQGLELVHHAGKNIGAVTRQTSAFLDIGVGRAVVRSPASPICGTICRKRCPRNFPR